MPLAWSGVEIAKDPKQSMDRLNGQASSQKHDNGRAYRLIDRSGFWSARAYLGLPAVRDLDENSKAMRENSRFPTDKVTVIGVIQKKNTINIRQRKLARLLKDFNPEKLSYEDASKIVKSVVNEIVVTKDEMAITLDF